MLNQAEFENLKSILQYSEGYKENSKPYKKLVQQGDLQKMKVITDTVQRIIVKKHAEEPIVQLNAMRLIKECFELFVQEFMDMVAENILPIMSQIAHFQSQNTKIDRGKEYFVLSEAEKNQNIEVIGNSFFRLVLECIYVWSKWLPNTQFAHTYQTLIQQNITFPTTFNYFKPDIHSTIEEIIQRRKDQFNARKKLKESQGSNQMSSTLHEENSNIYSSNINQGSQLQGSYINPSNNTNHQAHLPNINMETNTGGGPKENIEENPFELASKAIQHIQQIKNTLLEGLSKPTQMNFHLLDYFKQEFEKFSSNAQEYSQSLLDRPQDGTEDLFGSLYNENEFADLFVRHCNSYFLKEISWSEMQQKFASYINKPSKQGVKYGEVSQTIGEQYVSIRMQPDMLFSDTNNMPLKNINEKDNSHAQKLQNQEEFTEERKEKQDTVKKSDALASKNKDFNAEKHSKPQKVEEIHSSDDKKYGPFLSQSPHKKNPHDLSERLQLGEKSDDKRDEFSSYDAGRRSLREALHKTESEKYKCQLKSKTNFSKISQVNQSNMSNYSQSQRKPILTKYSTGVTQLEDRSNTNQENNPEDLNVKLREVLDLLAEVTEERDLYKQKYEESQREFHKIESELAQQRNKNNFL